MSILFEGAPFILLGTLLSGFLGVYLPSGAMEKLLPKNKIAAILVSGLLGIILPVCECAVVPVIRRLVGKGLPVSCAFAYMLAAPIVNPITIFSTWNAFPNAPEVWESHLGRTPAEFFTFSRVFLGYITAVLVGLIVLFIPLDRILKPKVLPEDGDHDHKHDHDHMITITNMIMTAMGNAIMTTVTITTTPTTTPNKVKTASSSRCGLR